MAQSGGTSQQAWRVWLNAVGAVVLGLAAAFSLVVGDYRYSLFAACGAAGFALIAFGINKRSRAWSVLVFALFIVSFVGLIGGTALL